MLIGGQSFLDYITGLYISDKNIHSTTKLSMSGHRVCKIQDPEEIFPDIRGSNYARDVK